MRGKKILKEWVLPLLLIGILYVTGWHRPVLSTLQRGLLYTGIFNSSVDATLMGPRVLADLKLADEAGSPIDMRKYQGKTLLLNFWASWCAPCLAEMPDFEQLHHEYADNPNIEVLMISVDAEIDKAKQLRDKKGYHFPIYRRLQLPEALQSNSIPATFVIGPEGRLRYEHRGMARFATEKFRAFLHGLSEEKN